MPSSRWSRRFAALCGIGSALWGAAAGAFQFPPLSDDLHTRSIHDPQAWVGGGFQSSGPINQSPAEFGPSPGLWLRSPDGNPASGDRFPVMTPGPLPGGLSPFGFNSSGMIPPVNQPAAITNNPAFRAQGQFPASNWGDWAAGAPPGAAADPSAFGQSPANSFQPNGATPFGAPGGRAFDSSAAAPNLPANWNTPWGLMEAPQTPANARPKPKVSWALETTQTPFIGLMGQVARPGVYEIEPRGTLLSDLLQEIGGLAKDASGQFRIIRNARPGLTTTYSGAVQFELMPGDLVIADAQAPQSSSRSSHAATPDAVQVGFVNLIDRPVVLKLRSEQASVYEILSIMRQDQGLASQIQIVAPPSHRGQGQPRPDKPLPSEAVLIFPRNVVKAERLAELPEPYRLRRESTGPAPSREAAPSHEPYGNALPGPAQTPRPQPSVRDWHDSAPLPSQAQPIAQPKIEQFDETATAPPPPTADTSPPTRAGGVHGTPRRNTAGSGAIARDSNMVLAPPAEDPVPTESSRTPVPTPTEPQPLDTDTQHAEPSRLITNGQRRPMPAARADDWLAADSLRPTLTAADLDEAEKSSRANTHEWSIWLPLLAAGMGLVALIGFGLSLRRRSRGTQPAAPSVEAMSLTRRAAQPSLRRDPLNELIDNQLPLTTEPAQMPSPMQFHGRPQPQKTLRLDQGHSLSKPHSAETVTVRQPTVGQTVRASKGEAPIEPIQTDARTEQVSTRSPATAAQKFRIDRPPTSRAEAAATATAPLSAGPTLRATPVSVLERALSAVHQREERGA